MLNSWGQIHFDALHFTVVHFVNETFMNSSAFDTFFQWVLLQSRLIAYGKTGTERDWSLIFPSLLPMAISLLVKCINKLKQVHGKVSYILQKVHLINLLEIQCLKCIFFSPNCCPFSFDTLRLILKCLDSENGNIKFTNQ